MTSAVAITVVGADGLVGGLLAEALNANRVVHGTGRGDPHEIPIASAAPVLAASDVVVNAQGLRQRGSLGDEAFRVTHVEATRNLVAQLRPGALLIHISSAAVLGRPGPTVDGRGPADPASFPMPFYAQVKYEAERVATEEGAQKGLSVVVLRPAVVCARPLDGMLRTLAHWLRRGLLLDLLPRSAKHHFCSGSLLAEVARAVAARTWPTAQPNVFTVADPFTLDNRELASSLIRHFGAPRARVPLPARAAGGVLRGLHAGGRLSGIAEILGVIGLDVAYRVDETLDELGLNRAAFARERVFDPLLAEEAALALPRAPEHVLVIGATGGVGQALLSALQARGARVSVVGRSELAGFAGWQKTVDVAHAEWAQILAEAEAHGPVDAVVFVAGTAALGPAARVPDDTAQAIFDLNFWSLSRAATAAAERWRTHRRRGSFVAVLSLAALRGMPTEAHYAASKAAAACFVQALRFEYPETVRIEAVYPGAIATPFRERAARFGLSPEDAARSGDPPELTAAAIVDVLYENKPGGPVGAKARAIAALDRISPRLYDRLQRARHSER